MRALVTGAAGFIGSRLAGNLAESGWHVAALDSFSPYYDLRLKDVNSRQLAAQHDITVERIDLTSGDVTQLVDGVDVVFHLAAQPGVRASWSDFDSYVRDNLTATQRVLDAVKVSRGARLVFASSSSVYGQTSGTVTERSPTHPFSPYGVTKLAAEALCTAYAQNYGLRTVSLRLFTVYGPGQRPDMAFSRLIDAALSGSSFPIYGDGSQVRAFTFVDDVVEAMTSAATADVDPGTVLNISGGSTTTLREAIEIVEEATGGSIRLAHLGRQAGDVRRKDADITRARDLLSWQPTTPLSVGLQKQVEHARRHVPEGHPEIVAS
jgi:nucleoside-diphosphate-sugar epimerase